jgi:hypothetical protein
MIKKISKKIIELIVSYTSSNRLKFNLIYYFNYWGDRTSRSGRGSSISNSKNITKNLEDFFLKNHIKIVLDIPCGDFTWMKGLNDLFDIEDINYIGADVSNLVIKSNKKSFGKENVRFKVLDLRYDTLPKADFILVRDCLFHLSFEDIRLFKDNIRKSSFKFIAISNHKLPDNHKNLNIKTGFFRLIDITQDPINFPIKPYMIWNDSSEDEPNKLIYVYKKDQFLS